MAHVQILDQKIKSLKHRELEILRELLPVIRQMDLSYGYLQLGFASLFDYLVNGVGYSEGSAQRRIDAARMLRDVPELCEKLETGEINLSQVTLVKKAIRQAGKVRKVSREEKKQILEKIQGQNRKASEQTVAAFFELPVLESEKQIVQKDSSVRHELTFSRELDEKIKLAQALLSHAVPSGSLVDYIEYLTDKFIAQKLPQKSPRKAPNADASKSANTNRSESEANLIVAGAVEAGVDMNNAVHGQTVGAAATATGWFYTASATFRL